MTLSRTPCAMYELPDPGRALVDAVLADDDVSAKSGELPILRADPSSATRSRASLVRRARLLASVGLAWHGIEAAVAIGAGVIAGSVALIGFGADSLIELAAGLVVLWRLATAARSPSAARSR
jgi:hypothetical protein